VVAENYPQLKSDANFRDLQAQLEGTENRITVARNRYIKAVQEYNVTVRSFPSNLTAMVFGFKTRPQLHGRERSRDFTSADGGFRQRHRPRRRRPVKRRQRHARRLRRAAADRGACCLPDWLSPRSRYRR
jgi:hypothetical protein